MVFIRTRIIVALALVAAMGIIATGWLDQRGLDHTQQGLQRALVTFGVSRALNGVISVAQGTEVAVEPVGIGMTFTPGQILDPVNDLIERFSTVVLVAGTAFGAQHVLLEVTASTIFTGVSVGLIALSLLCTLMWSRIHASLRSAVLRMTLTFVFLRLAVPGFAIAGELFYQQFLSPQYLESSEQLSAAATRLELLNNEDDRAIEQKLEDRSFLDSARDWMNGASEAVDWKKQLAEFSATAERISLHAIKLMVVFVFQTVLLPIFGVWLLLKGVRLCWSYQVRQPQEYRST